MHAAALAFGSRRRHALGTLWQRACLSGLLAATSVVVCLLCGLVIEHSVETGLLPIPASALELPVVRVPELFGCAL